MARRVVPARGAVMLATAVISLVLVGCDPRTGPATSGYWHSVIYPSGTSVHRYQNNGNRSITVSAPATNPDGNYRDAIVADAATASVDQQSCVTWHGPAATNIQPGVVLRSIEETHRTRLIMVTGNIIWGARTGLNVHVVDSAWPTSSPWKQVGGFTSTSVGNWATTQPLPWRICARAVGATVTVKAWSLSQAEPAWTDPGAARSFSVPTELVYAGYPGIYAGHLAPGESTRFSDIATRAIGG